MRCGFLHASPTFPRASCDGVEKAFSDRPEREMRHSSPREAEDDHEKTPSRVRQTEFSPRSPRCAHGSLGFPVVL